MTKKVQQISTILPIGLREERRVSTTSFRPGALLITRRGRKARTRRKTRSMRKSLLFFPTNAVMKASMREMMTKLPSILFQLSEKYDCFPRMNPHAIDFIAISIVKTKVNIWLLIPRIYLSLDQRGILGLSIANVIQLADMKVRMMKSNQPLEVKSLQKSLNLKAFDLVLQCHISRTLNAQAIYRENTFFDYLETLSVFQIVFYCLHCCLQSCCSLCS